ncbi:hypothetical protein T484DRAFT_1955034 [Baffinella frigidus]|nr:hypothetical protein T484DRAFT_1955034 [Cryptophyta sp. CCMP2293]
MAEAAPSKQEQLDATVLSLGTAKFGLDECTVRVAAVIESPEKYYILDARSAEESDISIIKGSITKADFEASPEKYADKPVVCYCTVGYISGGVVRELRDKGFNNVNNLGDGALLGYTLAQTAAGVACPLVKKDGTPTNEVHTFMPGLAPLAGEGMEAKVFQDPGAMLEAANARIKETTGL